MNICVQVGWALVKQKCCCGGIWGVTWLQKGGPASSVSMGQCDELLTGNITSLISRHLLLLSCIFNVLPSYDKCDIFPELTLSDGRASFCSLNRSSPLFCSFTCSGWVPAWFLLTFWEFTPGLRNYCWLIKMVSERKLLVVVVVVLNLGMSQLALSVRYLYKLFWGWCAKSAYPCK